MCSSKFTKESEWGMNANELADWIEKSPYSEYETAKQAATMLRQQQAEIEYWKEMFEKAMKAQEK
jgi:hypothetical protein